MSRQRSRPVRTGEGDRPLCQCGSRAWHDESRRHSRVGRIATDISTPRVLPGSLIPFQQSSSLVGDPACRGRRPRHRLSPGMSRKRQSRRPSLLVDQRRQRLPSIEPDRPASFPSQRRWRHLGNLLSHAGSQMRTLRLRKLQPASRSKAAARILFPATDRTLAGASLCTRFTRCFLSRRALPRRRLRFRRDPHVVNEVGIAAAGLARSRFRSRLLSRREMLRRPSSRLARIASFPGGGR